METAYYTLQKNKAMYSVYARRASQGVSILAVVTAHCCETLVNAMPKLNHGYSAYNIAVITHMLSYLIHGQSARSHSEHPFSNALILLVLKVHKTILT